jgi:hypothetical protein
MAKYKFQEYNEERKKVIYECFLEAYNLFPTGIPENAYQMFEQCETSREIPAEALRDKYIEYVNALLPFQNAKYTKPEYTIKRMTQFISERMYLQRFSIPQQSNPERDKYMYGI